MNPTSKPATINLGGRQLKLFFNLNTFSKYEEVSGGKLFPEFLASMSDALAEARGTDNPMAFLRKLSIQDLHKFLWSAAHEYKPDGEPYWPYTVGQFGAMVAVEDLPTLLPTILEGHAANSPPADERPTKASESIPSEIPTGSPESGVSDAQVLASLTMKLDG